MTDPITWDYSDPFITDILVKPQHIDDFRHANNVVYLTWIAKTAWDHSIALGIDFKTFEKKGCGLIVRHHEMDYLAPALEGEEIKVATWITGNDGRLRVRRFFQMVNAATGVTLLRAKSDFVCINIKTGRPTRMPPEFVTTYRLTGPADPELNRKKR